jgi:general secretion pathway protein K
MFIMVLLTTLVVYLVEDEYLAIRRAENQQESEQGFHIAVYGEQWARKILEEDLRDNQTDHAAEDWASEAPGLREDDTAVLQARVEDLQGRFNLNNLAAGRDELWYPAFRRLLTVLDLDPGLADAVVDWMDADINVSGHYGAEDAEYQLHSPSYRAANRPMADVGELAWIRGMTPEAIRALRPHVTVLPATDTRINVNTATAAVLRILAPEILDEGSAASLIAGRGETGYASVDSFLLRTELAGQWQEAENMISVRSEYFEVTSRVDYGRYATVLYSLIERSRNTRQARVIQRKRGVS